MHEPAVVRSPCDGRSCDRSRASRKGRYRSLAVDRLRVALVLSSVTFASLDSFDIEYQLREAYLVLVLERGTKDIDSQSFYSCLDTGIVGARSRLACG